MPRPAVFLDRDDTLIENRRVTAALPNPGDLGEPALVRLLAGASDACSRLAHAGYALVVISNQGGVARGTLTLDQVDACNLRMAELLRSEGGVLLSGVYICPYHPHGRIPEYTREHPWRKPAPGMLLEAAREHGLDLLRSWVIGDAERDMEAGIRAGVPRGQCLRICETPTPGHNEVGRVFPSIALAAEHILAHG